MPQRHDGRPRILLVDDAPTNLHLLRQILQDDYRLLFATTGQRALELAEHQPDLILLDVMLPQISGYEVCRQLKAQAQTAAIPVIFVSALSDLQDETQGFDAGGVDYIVKPVRAGVVRARVKSHLSLVHLQALRASQLEIVQRMARAAEYKDADRSQDVVRMSHYARALALALGCCPDWAEDLLHAAPLHDIGKIGLPDAVWLQSGPLDEVQWEQMRRHPQIGAAIIGSQHQGLLSLAYQIALGHHEQWDGGGYPQGLRGAAIPLEARIVAIADVFDALTSARPHKTAWSVDAALAHLQAQAGRHFDPHLVPVFVGLRPELEAIRERWPDPLECRPPASRL